MGKFLLSRTLSLLLPIDANVISITPDVTVVSITPDATVASITPDATDGGNAMQPITCLSI